MGCDTYGRIKGHIRPENIVNFIHQKWDKNVRNEVSKHIYKPISMCNWNFKINDNCDDRYNWYVDYGFIIFKYNGEERALFYNYENINSYENSEYYAEYELDDMIRSETTFISLSYYGSSVEIIKEIVAHFGGGWVDDNDCDDDPYYPVVTNVDGNIEPVRYVTMEEIRKVFGNNVVIKDK